MNRPLGSNDDAQPDLTILARATGALAACASVDEVVRTLRRAVVPAFAAEAEVVLREAVDDRGRLVVPLRAGTAAPVGALVVPAAAARHRDALEVVATCAALAIAAAERQQAVHAIAEAFPDLYLWIDETGRFVDARIGRDTELVFTPEQMLGKRPSEIDGGEAALRFERAVAHALATGEIVAVEYALTTPRDAGWFEARVVPLAADRALAIVRDVTRRRAAEDAARRADEQYRLVTDGVPVLISYVDRDERFRFVNRAYEQMFKTDRAQLLGRRVRDLVGEASYVNVAPYIARVLAGEAVRYENTVAPPGLDARQFDVSYVPHRDATGAVQGFFAMIVDVTEQRHLEEQLRQSQKMEAIGRLAGGIAHDFNNLLMVIRTATELARGAVRGGREPTAELDEISTAADRAAALTRQLLAFSRRDLPRRQRLDVDEIVGDTERMLRRVIGEHIELVIDRAAPGATVLADRGQLEQIVINLAVNARDAMPAGGTLTIRTALRSIADRAHGVEPGRYVEIAVADTGAGIPDAIRDRIFEPFFTTKDVDKGTGLGLATVYGIATRNGGAVAVASAACGTTFQVLLPASMEVGDERGDATARPRGGGGERLLLIEDEPAVRMLVRRALEEDGYAVVEAANGPAALALIERDAAPVGAVITDVIMPRMSGRAVVDEVRRRWPSVPAIFMSGYPEQHMEGLRLDPASGGAAATRFLAKPFTIDELLGTLRQVLDRDDRRG